MELDLSNKKFAAAANAVMNRGESLFLTGKAGTGKTTFLKYIKGSSEKTMVVLAPTGVAAINAEGQTIHSFFKIDFGPLLMNDKSNAPSNIKNKYKLNKKKIELVNAMELLVIDEVSMVRADLMDMMNRILKVYRNSNAPFGGVQVLMIGDVFQLPPVVTNNERYMIRGFYKSPFFFSSEAFKELMPTCLELDKVYRQHDHHFLSLLDKIRMAEISQKELDELNERSNAHVEHEYGYITLATHNNRVNFINRENLEGLQTEAFQFKAEKEKDFPESAAPTEYLLELKEGAQVMFVKNDMAEKRRFYNGTIGMVTELGKDKIVVKTEQQDHIAVDLAEWEYLKYEWDHDKKEVKKKVVGTWKQFPLRLAWAITVHKSQGLTFDRVIANLGQSFTDGQVYVALSRCISLEGLILSDPIPRRAIKSNPFAIHFSNWMNHQYIDG